MNSLKILNNKEKKEIEEKLREQFGVCKKIGGIFIQRGAERLFLYQGSLSEKEIKKIEKITVIERAGVYFGKLVDDKGEEKIRLSIDGSQILKDQITKNILELNEKQTEEWMMGHELNIKTGKRDFIIMKHKDDFLGTGKASDEKITNFIPKNRRLKEKK
jgi:NOL1/NOP2/fmu family ribosome biogenesis protein